MRAASRLRAGHMVSTDLVRPAGFDLRLRSTALRAAHSSEPRLLTSSSTNPAARAAVADSIEPVSIARIADGAPACLIERAVPLNPGKMPSFTSGNPSFVEGSRVAMR